MCMTLLEELHFHFRYSPQKRSIKSSLINSLPVVISDLLATSVQSLSFLPNSPKLEGTRKAIQTGGISFAGSA